MDNYSQLPLFDLGKDIEERGEQVKDDLIAFQEEEK